MLSDALQTAIGQEQVPDAQDQIHAREIVVATQDQGNDVITQLQNGTDFTQLALQLSTDTTSKAKGGDLGWISKGTLDKPVEDAVWTLQVPRAAESGRSGRRGLLRSPGAREGSRPSRPGQQLHVQRQKAYSDWLAGRRSSQDVKLQLSQPVRDWILSKIGVRP